MTSGIIGALRVNLGLDTAAFSAGVDQAKGKVERFAIGLNKRLGALGDIPGVSRLRDGLAAIGMGAGAALAAGSAAAAVGLGALSVGAINAAAQLKAMSSLANATPEEFQRLAYAAQSVGIENDKLADILKDVNDRVGDFMATGGGPMKDFFERVGPAVGVTADQFRKLSGPQALQLYVDSLEKANLNQQDFTFFMEAMASDSTALVPLLRNGGKAAQEYAGRLDALGGVMSTATVASLAAMKSSLSDVGVVIRGMAMQLGAAFAPAVAALATAFTDLLSKGSLLRTIFDAVSTAVGGVARLFAALVNIVGAVVSEVWNIVSSFAEWLNSVTGVGAAIAWLWDHGVGLLADVLIWLSDLITATGGWGGAITAVGQIASEVWDRIGQGVTGLRAIFDAAAAGMASVFAGAFATIVEKFAATTSAIAGGWNSLMGSLGIETNAQGMGQDLAASIRGAADSMAASASNSLNIGTWLMNDAMRPLESLAGINAQIAESGEAAAAGMASLGAGINAASNAADGGGEGGNGKGLKGLKGKLTELERATEEWRDTMSQAFSDFITKGGSFKDVLSQIIGKLAEMLANSAFNGLWNGMGGGGIFGGILGAFGIGRNANGTNNWRGGLTRVNERGGEIMNLPRGTQIIPHDISKRMADGAGRAGQMQISVNVSGARGNAEIESMVAQGVRSGIAQYDRQALPMRIKQISADGRRIG